MGNLTNKLSFSIQAVKANQRAKTVQPSEPELVAVVSTGKFYLTPAATSAMDLVPGDHVMFLNNIAAVESAVQARLEDIVVYANENNIDLDSYEGEMAVVAAFTQWYIAKGVPKFKLDGTPVLAKERMSKEEKMKFLEENKYQLAQQYHDELVEMFGDQAVEKYGNIDDEALAEFLTVDFVKSPEYHDCEGSRTTASGNCTGTGCKLNFSDSNIWNALRKDMSKDDKMNRVYKVLVDQTQEVPYFNGLAEVNVTVYPIEFKEDVKAVRAANNEATEE